MLWISDTQLPVASAVTQTIVSPLDSRGQRRRRGAIHRDPPAPIPEIGRIEQAVERHRRIVRVGEPAVPVAECELRGLDQEVDVVGRVAAALADVGPLKHPQHGERHQSLARRGDRGRQPSAVRHHRRLGEARAMDRKVRRTQRAPDRLARSTDLGRDRALVERAPALAGKPVERARDRRLDEPPSRRRRPPLVQIGRAERRERGRLRRDEVRRARRDTRLAG
jgi:hypothetical protein